MRDRSLASSPAAFRPSTTGPRPFSTHFPLRCGSNSRTRRSQRPLPHAGATDREFFRRAEMMDTDVGTTKKEMPPRSSRTGSTRYEGRRRCRQRTEGMGGLPGRWSSSVYWGNGPPTSQSRFARHGGHAVGDPDLGAPRVYPGAVVSFWQPIFTWQQPYWIGFLVHPSSASMLAWLRRSASERKAFEGRSFLGLEH